MSRSCTGPQRDGSCKMGLSTVKTGTVCSISTLEESSRFATLEVMDIILVNGVKNSPHGMVPSFLFQAFEIELLPLLHIRYCQLLPALPANQLVV